MKSNKTFVNSEEDCEINVRQLVYVIIKNWRRLLAYFVIAVVLAGAIQGALSVYSSKKSKEEVIAAQQTYQNELRSYNEQVTELEARIADEQTKLKRMQTYTDNSILMKIDPYNVFKASIKYSIVAAEQPLLQSENGIVDNAAKIIDLYIAYLNTDETYNQMGQASSQPTDSNYISEAVTISSDLTTGVITITIVNVSPLDCSAMMNVAKQRIADAYTEITKLTYAHTLTALVEGVTCVIDFDLQKSQINLLKDVTTLTNSLKSDSELLHQLQASGSPTWEYTSVSSTVKQVFKFMLVFALAGLFLALVVIIIQYHLSDRIPGAIELKTRFSLELLGAIPSGSKKRKPKLLDRLAYIVGGVKLKSADREKIIGITAMSICAMADTTSTNQLRIALVGSIDAETLQKIADQFNKAASGDRFITAGNPLMDVSTFENLKNAELAVVIEKQNQSTYSDILEECVRLTNWGKAILGIVLLDVDSI